MKFGGGPFQQSLSKSLRKKVVIVVMLMLLLHPLHLEGLAIVSPSGSITEEVFPKVSNRIICVANLDWYSPKDTVADMLVGALGNTLVKNITVRDFTGQTQRKRDQDKLHSGKAFVEFHTSDAAIMGMQALQDFSESKECLSELRLRFAPTYLLEPKEIKAGVAPTVLSPERIQLRKERAEQYARRRQRVAQATDDVIQSVLDRDSEGFLDPSLPVLDAPELDWSQCPLEIDPVRGGGLEKGTGRGKRKRAAVEAFLYILQEALLEPVEKGRLIQIADLGCGTGNLANPLAWFLQTQNVSMVGVDFNADSLTRMTERARSIGMRVETMEQDLNDLVASTNSTRNLTCSSSTGTSVATMLNFTAVVSLHACGTASDLAIAAAVKEGVPFAVSPCCIGKVKKSMLPGRMPALDPDDSVGRNPVISYPRSTWLKVILTTSEYRLLAAAADYGVTENDADPEELVRRQRCKMAKRIVEMDRLQWASERHYCVGMVELPRIGPLYPKRELLLGAQRGSIAASRISRLSYLR